MNPFATYWWVVLMEFEDAPIAAVVREPMCEKESAVLDQEDKSVRLGAFDDRYKAEDYSDELNAILDDWCPAMICTMLDFRARERSIH